MKNGVIHVIDQVLLPPTVVGQALANDSFSILVQAVVKAGLVETLSGAGPFTILAPTNEAFQSLFTTLETVSYTSSIKFFCRQRNKIALI